MRQKPMRSVLPEVERRKIVHLAHQTIKNGEARDVINYLMSDARNFSPDEINTIIDKYKIGYVPSHVKNRFGDKHEFAGRIILPIYDQHDRLVALSSRDWRPNSNMKFFHESFDKSLYLYGLNIAKENIIKQKMAIVVEGEFDVQKLYVKGFKFTIGVLGSALQLSQIALLSRYCREIFLIFDGDEAGFEAANKIIKMALQRQFYVDFLDIIPVVMPKNIDPDIFLDKYGKAGFIKLLKQSRETYKERFE